MSMGSVDMVEEIVPYFRMDKLQLAAWVRRHHITF